MQLTHTDMDEPQNHCAEREARLKSTHILLLYSYEDLALAKLIYSDRNQVGD